MSLLNPSSSSDRCGPHLKHLHRHACPVSCEPCALHGYGVVSCSKTAHNCLSVNICRSAGLDDCWPLVVVFALRSVRYVIGSSGSVSGCRSKVANMFIDDVPIFYARFDEELWIHAPSVEYHADFVTPAGCSSCSNQRTQFVAGDGVGLPCLRSKLPWRCQSASMVLITPCCCCQLGGSANQAAEAQPPEGVHAAATGLMGEATM